MPIARSFALPDGFKRSQRGSCVAAVLTLLSGLTYDDQVIEGYVLSGRLKHEHTWLEVNGIFFDPTAEQFSKLICWQEMPMRYQVKRRYSIAEYTVLGMLYQLLGNPGWHERVQSFGGCPPGWLMANYQGRE